MLLDAYVRLARRPSASLLQLPRANVAHWYSTSSRASDAEIKTAYKVCEQKQDNGLLVCRVPASELSS